MNAIPASTLIAVAIGAIHTYLITLAWVYIGASPLPMWVLSLNAPEAVLLNALFCIDVVISLILCLPAAFLLCWLRPHKLWFYLSIAILPGFLWHYRLFFEDGSLLQDWPSFLPGALMFLFPLPFSAYIVRWYFQTSDRVH